MRRLVAALFLVTSLTSMQPVPAAALSAGCGVSLAFETLDVATSLPGVPTDTRMETLPFGVKLFLDARYLEASVGWLIARNGTVFVTDGGYYATATFERTMSYITLSAYLKFPFSFRTNEIYPLLGVEYRFNIAALDGAGNDLTVGLTPQQLSDLNQLWVQAGGGMEFIFGDFSLRAQLILGLKVLSATDESNLATLESEGYSNPTASYFTINLDLLLGWTLVNERSSNER
jgi:hypothetical protein